MFKELELAPTGTHAADVTSSWMDLGDLYAGNLVVHIYYTKGSETSVQFFIEDTPNDLAKEAPGGEPYPVVDSGVLSSTQAKRLTATNIARYIRLRTAHVGDIVTTPPQFYVRATAR
jgi:hypothetical protein